MQIHSLFDAGSIEVVRADSPDDIELKLRADNAGEFRQWFYFQLADVRGKRCRLRLSNASDSSYPDGWSNYWPLASYDRTHWFRVPADYDGTELRFEWLSEQDQIWFAYFEPYSLERHRDQLARWQQHPAARWLSLGQSLQGRPIDLLQIGTAQTSVPVIWLVARQHPGETMGQWCIEGLIDRLLDPADATSHWLRQRAQFYLVPNINPDGSYLGNLRSNAAGCNLNREWLLPSAQISPEVLVVRQKMLETGVSLFIDLHGDETIEQVFIDGNAMLPDWNDAQQQRQQAFIEDLQSLTDDFQTKEGYELDRFSDEMLTLASKWVGHQFGCLSLTLEMPFKDHNANPNPDTHWSAARSYRLGETLLDAIARHLRRHSQSS